LSETPGEIEMLKRLLEIQKQTIEALESNRSAALDHYRIVKERSKVLERAMRLQSDCISTLVGAVKALDPSVKTSLNHKAAALTVIEAERHAKEIHTEIANLTGNG